jgi:hypothetical protein
VLLPVPGPPATMTAFPCGIPPFSNNSSKPGILVFKTGSFVGGSSESSDSNIVTSNLLDSQIAIRLYFFAFF